MIGNPPCSPSFKHAVSFSIFVHVCTLSYTCVCVYSYILAMLFSNDIPGGGVGGGEEGRYVFVVSGGTAAMPVKRPAIHSEGEQGSIVQDRTCMYCGMNRLNRVIS
jgi:hypothetical protein